MSAPATIATAPSEAKPVGSGPTEALVVMEEAAPYRVKRWLSSGEIKVRRGYKKGDDFVEMGSSAHMRGVAEQVSCNLFNDELVMAYIVVGMPPVALSSLAEPMCVVFHADKRTLSGLLKPVPGWQTLEVTAKPKVTAHKVFVKALIDEAGCLCTFFVHFYF